MRLEAHELRQWLQRIAEGKASRRHFLRTMLGLGLSGPFVARLLATSVPAATPNAYPGPQTLLPRQRGGGGRLRLLWWQAPTMLNAHLAVGTKDYDAARVVYEPLAAFNRDGEFVPILAAEIPSVDNGGLAQHGTAVTWRLKKDVVWHDGQPFTANDVIFTWEYAADPAAGAVTSGSYHNIARIDKRNDYTVTVVFKEPTPFWYDAFFGGRGHILPKHLFATYKGQNSRNAPYNLTPVGTGPYKIVDFKPGEWYSMRSIRTIMCPIGPSSTPWSSRGVAMRPPPPAPCCRLANTTSPGTCKWRRRCLSASHGKAPAAACRSIRAPGSSTFSSTAPIPGLRWRASAAA